MLRGEKLVETHRSFGQVDYQIPIYFYYIFDYIIQYSRLYI